MEHLNEVIDILGDIESPRSKKSEFPRISSESPHLIARNALPFEKDSYPTASVYKRSQVTEMKNSKKRQEALESMLQK